MWTKTRKKRGCSPVFSILTGFNADPDLSFKVNAEPDPGIWIHIQHFKTWNSLSFSKFFVGYFRTLGSGSEFPLLLRIWIQPAKTMRIRIHSTGVNKADIDGALYRPTNNVVDKVGGHLPPAAVVEAVEERDEVSEAQQHQHVVVAVYKNQARTVSQHF